MKMPTCKRCADLGILYAKKKDAVNSKQVYEYTFKCYCSKGLVAREKTETSKGPVYTDLAYPQFFPHMTKEGFEVIMLSPDSPTQEVQLPLNLQDLPF